MWQSFQSLIWIFLNLNILITGIPKYHGNIPTVFAVFFFVRLLLLLRSRIALNDGYFWLTMGCLRPESDFNLIGHVNRNEILSTTKKFQVRKYHNVIKIQWTNLQKNCFNGIEPKCQFHLLSLHFVVTTKVSK